MIDELLSPTPFEVDEFPMITSFVAAAGAGAAEESAGCVGPFEAAAACFHLILSAESSSDYQGNYTVELMI